MTSYSETFKPSCNDVLGVTGRKSSVIFSLKKETVILSPVIVSGVGNNEGLMLRVRSYTEETFMRLQMMP